ASAMSMGLFYRPQDNLMFSFGGSMGNGENMVNAGVTIALDKGVSTSKAVMARNIRTLSEENAAIREENSAMKAQLNNQEEKLNTQEEKLNTQEAEIRELKKALAALAAKVGD
ncbi:MAG: hypothetical protein IJ858_07985, partial [Acidaminococcaceae bacterium]|nr:hypothetical protein [Acidaminococcaceae bacterium]